MSKKVSWIFEDNWSFWMINWEYLITKWDENWAKPWDKVEAIDISDNPNIVQFKIIKIINETLEEIENIIVWVYKKTDNWKWWYIDIPRERKGIFVSNWDANWAETWDKVELVLLKIWNRNKWIITNIIQTKIEQLNSAKEFLWNDFKLQNKVDILKVALSEWARIKFPDEVLEESNKLNWSIDSLEIEKRQDLRNLLTITIDWADSKDLDDAISIEKLHTWEYKLYVHIADVTHYVNEKKELDKEALERATSIYLVDKVIPMLPERLSNDLCSLNPNTDKLTLTCEMLIDKNWNININNSKVYESIINSNYRTTYKEIEEIKSWELWKWKKLLFWWKINKKLISLVSIFEKLADNLNESTRKNWELEFDFDETKVIIDNEWNPIWFEAYPKYPSNDWIKAFMVAANRTVSKIYSDKPFLHRTHKNPKEESLTKLQNILSLLEVNSTIVDDPTSKNFSKLLEEVKWHDKEKFLEKAILKTMQRANYTNEREWHFWLSLGYYSHFTSPIRRYPDLQIHRIIKEIINWKFNDEREKYYENNLNSVANKSSLEEDKSEDIEKKVNKLMALKYMSDKIWKPFKWYISDIKEKKVFVELENTITWVVNIDTLVYDFNKLCEWLYEWVSENWDKLNVWDNVDLMLTSVDFDNLRINFDII